MQTHWLRPDLRDHRAQELAARGNADRLNQQPELLFTLRRVDAKDLVARAGTGLPLAKKAPAAGKILDQSKLAEVFGIEMADAVVPDIRAKGAPTGKKIPAKKAAAKKKKALKHKTVTGASKRVASAPKKRKSG